MLKVSVAHSFELESADAANDIIEQSKEKLGDEKPHAGFLFVAIEYDYQLILDEIMGLYPDLELIGCTTDGELSSVHEFQEDSVVLMLICSDTLSFKAGVADNVSVDTQKLIKQAVDLEKAQLQTEPKMCISTPTSLTANGNEVIEGVQASLGTDFPIFGGGAGDQWQIKCTYQFYKSGVYKDAVPFMLIGGPLVYSFGIETGWMPIGQKTEITNSEKNVVYKIGDQTALDFYKHFLGDHVGFEKGNAMGEYPLAVFDEESDKFYLRSPSGIDHENGSITFVGNVLQGTSVCITHSTRDRIVDATKLSVKNAINDFPLEKPSLILCFSCSARKQVLGTRVNEEFDAFTMHFDDVPILGFYTYGEICPLKKDSSAKLHNETFVNVLIGVE